MKLFLTGRPSWVGKADLPISVPYAAVQDRKRGIKPAHHAWIVGPPPPNTPLVEYINVVDRCAEAGMLVGVPVPVGEENWNRVSVEHLERARKIEGLPVLPVIHANTLSELTMTLKLYEAHGLPLQKEELVSVGVIPEGRWEARDMLLTMNYYGLKLHAHNQSVRMLKDHRRYLVSADSEEWRTPGRKTSNPWHPHRNCGSCMNFAESWRQDVLAATGDQHPTLFD